MKRRKFKKTSVIGLGLFTKFLIITECKRVVIATLNMALVVKTAASVIKKMEFQC